MAVPVDPVVSCVGALVARAMEEPVMAQTVLVVEDEVKIRELLRSYLERAGLDVVTTGSGAEAITLAARAVPDLVILDLRLPDVPGEEVAREVRRAGTDQALDIDGMDLAVLDGDRVARNEVYFDRTPLAALRPSS